MALHVATSYRQPLCTAMIAHTEHAMHVVLAEPMARHARTPDLAAVTCTRYVSYSPENTPAVIAHAERDTRRTCPSGSARPRENARSRR
jgi:hypothetical protein